MKFEKLVLKNFQSHYDSSFGFDKGFNCIIGSTNSGKSSIIRALKFLLFNDWDSGYISHGESKSKVALLLDDENSVVRIKGKTDNKFTLNQQVYENFGTTIPKEIVDALNIRNIEVDGKPVNLNLTSQIDSLFFLTCSPSTRAKLIDSLSGVDIVDIIISDLNKDCKRIDTEKKFKNDQLIQYIEDIKQFDDLDRKIEVLSSVEKLIADLYKYEEELEYMVDLNGRINTCKTMNDILISEYQNISKLDVNNIEKSMYNLERQELELGKLND
jgi:exonuclease SbcC